MSAGYSVMANICAEGDAAAGAEELIEHRPLLVAFADVLDAGGAAFVGPARQRPAEVGGDRSCA